MEEYRQMNQLTPLMTDGTTLGSFYYHGLTLIIRRQTITRSNAGSLSVMGLWNKVKWNWNKNAPISVQENYFENVVCKTAAMFSLPPFVCTPDDQLMRLLVKTHCAICYRPYICMLCRKMVYKWFEVHSFMQFMCFIDVMIHTYFIKHKLKRKCHFN